MTEINRYSLMMEALAELQPEIDAARQTQVVPSLPSLSAVLTNYEPMPAEALFLGVASDGLPMLLNLHDPVPGPLLILGDAGAGKTNLLQVVACAAGIMHQPHELQFGVLTNHTEEWNGLDQIPNSVGIFPLYGNTSQDFILSVSSWAHENKSSNQVLLLLLDDLESVSKLDFDARQRLRWLLLRGPARRVWPIVTLNADKTDSVQPWLDAFHTRIFGAIQDSTRAKQLSVENADVSTLNVGTQFTIPEGNRWVRFWLPSIN